MIFDDLMILKLQILAALLMGWDYFFSTSLRGNIDNFFRNQIYTIQQNTDKTIILNLSYLRTKIKIILISCLLFIGGIILIFPIIRLHNIYLVFSIFFIGIIFTTYGVKKLFEILFPKIVHLGIQIIVRLISMFLIKTEKGVIAGIGFVFLLISFGMRYFNITHT